MWCLSNNYLSKHVIHKQITHPFKIYIHVLQRWGTLYIFCCIRFCRRNSYNIWYFLYLIWFLRTSYVPPEKDPSIECPYHMHTLKSLNYQKLAWLSVRMKDKVILGINVNVKCEYSYGKITFNKVRRCNFNFSKSQLLSKFSLFSLISWQKGQKHMTMLMSFSWFHG